MRCIVCIFFKQIIITRLLYWCLGLKRYRCDGGGNMGPINLKRAKVFVIRWRLRSEKKTPASVSYSQKSFQVNDFHLWVLDKRE